MNLHLFSSPGENDIRYIIEACQPYLKDKDDPVVAFMPLASFSYFWQDCPLWLSARARSFVAEHSYEQ